MTYQLTVHYQNGSSKSYSYSILELNKALDKLNSMSCPAELWFLADGVREHFVGSNFDENGVADFI